MRGKALWVMVGGGLLAACGQADESRTAGTIHVQTASATLVLAVEVVDNDTERQQGLMYRRSLPEDAGMVFLWEQAEPRSFWMKNTYIPLDIVYMREGRVVGIAPMAKPLDETPIPSGVPADSVLEVNGGWAARHGLEVGDAVNFR